MKCEKYGHQSRSCRKTIAPVNMETNTTCEFCQRLDHVITNCPYKREYEAKAQGNEREESTDTVGLH